VIRAFDPWPELPPPNADGRMPLEIELRGAGGELVDAIRN